MKYSTRLSDAVHLMILVHLSKDNIITSNTIANSVQTNPSYVRQIMAQLKADGLLNSSQGQATPTLNRTPEKITLFDIYQAVEKGKPLLHLDTHTNPECGIGINIQLALADYYEQIQNEIECSMSKITLQNVIDNYFQRVKKLDLEAKYGSISNDCGKD